MNENLKDWPDGKVYAKDTQERLTYEEACLEESVSLESIYTDTQKLVRELLDSANLKPGSIMVLGCSTSEVQGKRIGSYGNTDVAKSIVRAVRDCLTESGVFLAVQCCEHLNRSLVVERKVLEKYGLTEVTVLPVPHAGGAAAFTAMRLFEDPVVVESIQAHAGIDVGDTLIGMHLRPVAVPVRLSVKSIGYAHVTAARTRPKLVGGKRAVYDREEFEKWVKGEK